MILAGKLIKTIWVRLLIVCLIVLGFMAGTKVAYDAVILQQNKERIAELSRQTIDRAELLADYAVITLSDLAAAGLGRCDAESLMEIRRSVYLRGAVKDVQVLGANNELRCAGLPQARLLGVANFDLDEGYAARSGNIFLHDIGMDSSGLLGIAWRFRSDLTFLAVLNVDSLMFEVFPAALRDQARADLLLGDDQSFARHVTFSESEMPIIDPVVFSDASARYPMQTRFALSMEALRTWKRESEPYVIGAGGVLGLVLGVLVAGLLSRPVDPTREMQAALRKGEFVPFMQPLFAIDGGRITGCEVLARWVKPDGHVISPLRFIPLAEDNGLIVPITRSIIRSALVALSAHLKADENFKVAFNIVPADLVSENFAGEICDIARDAGVAHKQIVLELTERQQFADLPSAIAAIKMLQELGFRVALDDTGTGHNGLSYVQELGADIIKIDKHFVDIIGMDRAATTIIQMLVRLAADLGMTTVAEGIETEQQLKALRDCNVDEGQGFLVSKPLPVDMFLAFVDGQQQSGAAQRAA